MIEVGSKEEDLLFVGPITHSCTNAGVLPAGPAICLQTLNFDFISFESEKEENKKQLTIAVYVYSFKFEQAILKVSVHLSEIHGNNSSSDRLVSDAW